MQRTGRPAAGSLPASIFRRGCSTIVVRRKHPVPRVITHIPDLQLKLDLQPKHPENHLITARHLPQDKDLKRNCRHDPHPGVQRQQECPAHDYEERQVRDTHEHCRAGATSEDDILMHSCTG